MKLVVLSVLVAALAFASANEEFRLREALRALERYANKISDNVYYVRAVGKPSLQMRYIPTTRGTLTDVLLSPTSCTQKDVAKLGEFVSVKDLNEKCPPPGDDVKPLMKCSTTVSFIWDSVRAIPELTKCGQA